MEAEVFYEDLNDETEVVPGVSVNSDEDLKDEPTRPLILMNVIE